jgi:hypothetical protein
MTHTTQGIQMNKTHQATKSTKREDALDRLADLEDTELYREINGEMIELTEAGVDLAEGAGLTVDVDAYGCAYCVEAAQSRD